MDDQFPNAATIYSRAAMFALPRRAVALWAFLVEHGVGYGER